LFQDIFWRLKEDEHWAIMGPNGSGKSTLVRSLWGGTPLRSGRILFHFSGCDGQSHPASHKDAIGYVSFELHQRLLEGEAFQDELREYAGQSESFTTARDLICSALNPNVHTGADEAKLGEITDLLAIHPLLARDMSTLSTGEMRKALIARALMKSPRLLILDEPFDGLDEASRATLARSIERLMTGRLRVILVTHRLEQILSRITHVLLVKNGRVFLQGPKQDVLTSGNISRLFGSRMQVERDNGSYRVLPDTGGGASPSAVPGALPEAEIPEKLVEMHHVTVKYGEVLALVDLTWTVRRGENWAVTGPNGAGKTTLLKMILGETLQGYANEVYLFGKRRGTGETIWQIKQHLGVVSSDLQVRYRKKMRAYEVIASGLFDSIGLYRPLTAPQRATVDMWIDALEINDLAREPFHQLSYGQKRLILLARAMAKSPALLILDEPCHGLDIANRTRILAVIDRLGRGNTQLLYVTHHRAEIPGCITHILELNEGSVVRRGRRD
jgi:molybdate transport system ATP-binding protein